MRRSRRGAEPSALHLYAALTQDPSGAGGYATRRGSRTSTTEGLLVINDELRSATWMISKRYSACASASNDFQPSDR